MNIREIISNIIRGVVRANSAAEKSAHRRHRNPKLENSSVRYLNIRKLDLHVPPGLASIEQEWSVDREVTVNIIPDASLKAQNRPSSSSPRATSKSRSKLEFHKFLGSVFASLVQAEEMAARATVKLLSEMAVDDKKGDRRTDSSHNYHLGKIRTVTFEYLGVDFEGKTVKKELQIPLLSLITVPVLQIRDAKLDFEIEIFHDNRSTLRTKQGDIEPKELPLSDMPSEKFPLEESIPRLMITVPANRIDILPRLEARGIGRVEGGVTTSPLSSETVRAAFTAHGYSSVFPIVTEGLPGCFLLVILGISFSHSHSYLSHSWASFLKYLECFFFPISIKSITVFSS